MTTTLSFSQDTHGWPPTFAKASSRPDASSRTGVRNVEKIQLHDIRRQATAQSLVPSILSGLKAEDRESPSLLLWNDRGLSLFDAVLESPDYYLATREWSLLRETVDKIVSSISSGDRLIELGAG